MSLADDTRQLRDLLGWSAEVRQLAALLEQGDASPGELTRAGEAVLQILPMDAPYRRYRSAVERLRVSTTARNGSAFALPRSTGRM